MLHVPPCEVWKPDLPLTNVKGIWCIILSLAMLNMGKFTVVTRHFCTHNQRKMPDNVSSLIAFKGVQWSTKWATRCQPSWLWGDWLLFDPLWVIILQYGTFLSEESPRCRLVWIKDKPRLTQVELFDLPTRSHANVISTTRLELTNMAAN